MNELQLPIGKFDTLECIDIMMKNVVLKEKKGHRFGV